MTSSNDNPIYDRDDGAARWARQSLDRQTPREIATLDAWRQDRLHDLDWREIDMVMGRLDDLAASSDIRDMREAALAMQPGHARSKWPWIVAGIAACFIALIPVVGTLASWMTQQNPEMIAPSFYVTRIDEQRNVRLEDGSVVMLNPSTKIAVTLSAKLRYIRIISGHALFKVAKSRNWPFVVEAGNQKITATGTAFDVRVDAGGAMSVLLVEGSVNVAPAGPSFIRELFPSIKTKVLVPGQKLSADDEGNRFVENAASEFATYTDRDRILFSNSTIGDAIAQINRRSTIHIEISDPHIAALRVSGVYNVDRGEDFLTALTAFYPLAIHQKNDGSMSISWNDEARPSSHAISAAKRIE